jgi:hyperosmotically inducible protein
MTQRIGWALSVAAVLVATAACNRDEAATAAPESDTAITTTVQARFFGDSLVKSHDVDVDTDDGVVTLTGSVATEAQRTQAAALAQKVQGVTRVQNNLKVEPGEVETAEARSAEGDARPRDPDMAARGERTDAEMKSPSWITMKVQAKYFADDVVKGRRINVDTSQNGAVTLEGEVESDAERRRAVELARATEGVVSVADRLRLVAAEAPAQTTEAREGARTDGDFNVSDPWLTAKIESKYFLDAEVKGRKIDVSTESGIVTLTGEVASAAERRQALALARSTDGVKDVVDQLKVVASQATEAPAAGPGGTRTAAVAPRDDDWIETRIQSKYFLEDELKAEDIAISSQAGKVTLEGAVDSPDAKETAEEIARETSGVAEVVNRIAVNASAASRSTP